MSIAGARFWNDRSRFYTQVNNPTEEQLRKAGVGSWLETCGPTAAVNCLAAVGHTLDIHCPGPYRPQPEEVLTDYFNDPRNYEALRAERSDVRPDALQGNRVPQYYPLAVREVFGAHARFMFLHSWRAVTEYLAAGWAVQLCLKNPGHYLAAVAYDSAADEIIYHDSWPARVGGDGFARRMKREEYEQNVQNYVVLYGGSA
jgi:hypothetical protein